MGTIDLAKARESARRRVSWLIKEFAKIRKEEIEKTLEKFRKNGFAIIYHKRTWVFEAKSGEKIQMREGYYTIIRGIFKRIAPKK